MTFTRAIVVCLVVATVLLTAAPAVACPWHKSLFWMGLWGPGLTSLPNSEAGQPAFDAQFWTDGAPGTPVSVKVEGTAGDVGQWSPPEPWPVIAIHAALLPTGNVLHYSYPDGGAGSSARIWNPRTGTFSDSSLDVDIFCSGLSFLADGRLFVSGGNDNGCTFQGRDVSHTLNPRTGVWRREDDMSVGRWYPNNVTLGDGRVLITSGLSRTCQLNDVMELYTPGSGISVVSEGQRALQLYPRMHLLSSGELAHVGPEDLSSTFAEGGGWTGVDTMTAGFRWDGSSVLVPGEQDEVMSCGGSSAVVSNTCERIDFGEASPQWRTTGSMTFARSHADLLILPDRSVLTMGGGTNGLYGDPVLNPEIYDPVSESWTLLPPHVHGRMYHATTVLLPDARVIVAGQDFGDSAFTAEIYEPAYLFRGPRPRISSVPRRIRFGTDFVIGSPDADGVTGAVLISPTAVTHSVNTSQRLVDLSFSQTATGELTATAPAHGNIAPPGFYMLFLLNDQGVPSRARFVRLTP